MKRKNSNKHRECSLCGTQEGKLHPCEGGFICVPCLERGRAGNDTTTRAVRAQSMSMAEKARANMYRHWGDNDHAASHEKVAQVFADKSAELFGTEALPGMMAGGEVKPASPSRIANTLAVPDVVALDASAHRLQLLDRMGLDCAAMALDAADSIKAENSLEKMLAHQLAIAHKTALEITDKAMFQQDSIDKARLMSVAIRFMEVYQKGLLTLQRLRQGGQQTIIVQHIHVAPGGQAIVGDVQTGGGIKNGQ